MPSTPVTPLESHRVINGREGKVFAENAVFIAWAESVEARMVIDRSDIIRAGTHVTGYKAMGASGSGTLNGFHVTSRYRRMIAEYMTTGIMPKPTTLVLELSDPEAYAADGVPMVEIVTLKGVKFWETALGFDTGDVVRDDFPFTFEGLSFDETITPGAFLF